MTTRSNTTKSWVFRHQNEVPRVVDWSNTHMRFDVWKTFFVEPRIDVNTNTTRNDDAYSKAEEEDFVFYSNTLSVSSFSSG